MNGKQSKLLRRLGATKREKREWKALNSEERGRFAALFPDRARGKVWT